jgi:aspartyl-tRNA(Asn)/glutamyl-tRNA(Gln) amidotransferase subunit A
MTASVNTLQAIRRALADHHTSSAALVSDAIARACDPGGEGVRAFLSVDTSAATERARELDRNPALAENAPLRGIPISIKDLLDVAGQPTWAASATMCDAEPAARDAEAVRRLRLAGAVLVGRTNLSEFAFSGVGTNPAFGTPRNPFDRAAARIPGGSSSGAAVSVADGMAAAAIGSDTGGSVRIPAALCGLAGFKPTQLRVPLDGVLPLSPTLDSVGPIAASIRCCASVDAVLTHNTAALRVPPLESVSVAVPRDVVLDDLDPDVAEAFTYALRVMRQAGCRITDVAWPELGEIRGMLQQGSIVAAEAYAWHRKRLQERGAQYDPRVRERLELGARMSAADYLDWLSFRRRLALSANRRLGEAMAWVMPTVPIVAPPIAPLLADAMLWSRVNAALLRNPMIANLIDGCSLTLPCHEPGNAPVGLMLTGTHGTDQDLLGLGVAIESLIRSYHGLTPD